MSFAWRRLSDSLFHRVGAALRNDLAPERFLLVFSPDLVLLSLLREKERREQGVLYSPLKNAAPSQCLSVSLTFFF